MYFVLLFSLCYLHFNIDSVLFWNQWYTLGKQKSHHVFITLHQIEIICQWFSKKSQKARSAFKNLIFWDPEGRSQWTDWSQSIGCHNLSCRWEETAGSDCQEYPLKVIFFSFFPVLATVNRKANIIVWVSTGMFPLVYYEISCLSGPSRKYSRNFLSHPLQMAMLWIWISVGKIAEIPFKNIYIFTYF